MREIEVIVVVDGPDPETLQALASIDDSRVRVIALSTGVGASGARNAGIGEAHARWIALLDDDDEWFPRKLETQWQTAQQCSVPHPIVSCRLLARSPEGDLVWPRRTPAPGEPIGEYLFCQHGLRGGEGVILTPTILTTRDLLLRIPFGQNLPRHNDTDWLLRAVAVADVKVVFVPDLEPLGIWHMDTDRPRISNTADWRYSLDWANRNRELMTPRAYASFVLIWASSTAARGNCWRAFWKLPWEALAHGKPRVIDLLAHLIIWLVPIRMRSRLSVWLDSRRRNLACRPTAPNRANRGTLA
jgi:glycosyltransferase involved in cell wall biosynthesis